MGNGADVISGPGTTCIYMGNIYGGSFSERSPGNSTAAGSDSACHGGFEPDWHCAVSETADRSFEKEGNPG